MGIRDFVSVIREISFDELESEARIAPRLLVISSSSVVSKTLAERLFGADAGEYVDTHAFSDSGIDPYRYDTIVTLGPLDASLGRDWREQLRRVKEPLRLVEVGQVATASERELESIRRRIADSADDRAIAIGRYIPMMKSACAHQLVTETATVNGQFALVSNLPTLLPLVGNVLAVGADFFVLTKNQLMLIFKLAAIHGRDLDNRWRIYSEMMPVIGAGLVWRTVAREVATLMPLAIGTVPKVAIAFAGTWVIGESAEFYYERGEKLNKEQMRELYAQALEIMRKNPITPDRLRALPDRISRSKGEESNEE
ncbi:MAG TPA: hypothetical protein VHA53_07330 [Nitrolancea sp.]|nr:hypothetical protein [Nitrolancea sp.]